jgi:hypothetical protein
VSLPSIDIDGVMALVNVWLSDSLSELTKLESRMKREPEFAMRAAERWGKVEYLALACAEHLETHARVIKTRLEEAKRAIANELTKEPSE